MIDNKKEQRRTYRKQNDHQSGHHGFFARRPNDLADFLPDLT